MAYRSRHAFPVSFLILLLVYVGAACDGASGSGSSPKGATDPDGSVNTSCVDMHMLEARAVEPSAVGLFVSVDNCQGEPVTNLDPSRFVIEEDGQPLSVEASVTPIPLKGQEIFVDLLIDMSTSTASYRDQLFQAAEQFVDAVSASGTNIQFGIYAFAGDPAVKEWLGPNLDPGIVKAKIASLSTYVPGDVNSTNLYGAVEQTVTALETSSEAFRERNFGGAFTAEYLIVFTAGRDTSKRVTLAETVARIQKTPVSVLGIAVDGPDYDADAAAALKQIAWAGVVSTNQSSLASTFGQLANRMNGQFKRTYLIGYCSPARATKPRVTVRLAAPTTTRTAAEAQFDATAFGPGCSSAVFGDCGTKACGGLGCGACDDRTSACVKVSGACENFCQKEGKCGGISITNVRGYEQVCESGPTNTACDGQCVDTTSDLNNCGSCGNVCMQGATCGGAAPGCTCPGGPCPNILATETTGLRPTMALDATGVYFLAGGSQGTVKKVALAGGLPVTLASGQPHPTAIAVDGSYVYWTNGGDGTVMKVPLAGGVPVAVATGQTTPSGIAVDATSVYWTTAAVSSGTGTVRKAPLAGGGAAVTIASTFGTVTELAVDGTSAYWLYFGGVAKVPLGGGTTVFLATDQASPHNMAVDGTSVYWLVTTTEVGTGASGGMVMRVPVGGGTPALSIASDKGLLHGLAIDATSVYWGGHIQIKKMPLAGGPAIALTLGIDGDAMAVDGMSLYWVAPALGTIWKRTPK